MEIIELSFRKESVFLLKSEIINLTNEKWFLSTLLDMDFSDDPLSNKIELCEDKNTAMSLIESLRYNRLIVLDGVSLEYLLALSEKWCLPEFLIENIKDKIQSNNNNKQKNNMIDNIVFQCYICNIGFKMSENTKESCKTHTKMYSLSAEKYPCCGNLKNSPPCGIGYHTLSDLNLTEYLRLKKDNF